MSENNGKKVVRAVHVNVVLTLKTVLNVRTNLFIQILFSYWSCFKWDFKSCEFNYIIWNIYQLKDHKRKKTCLIYNTKIKITLCQNMQFVDKTKYEYMML